MAPVVLVTRELPDELKALRQWLVWKYELRPGKDKPAKVPYQPRTGHRARTDTPATWATWPQALACAQHGGWDGLGFVFTAADPYCGIDLDDCRDAETGEIASWAQQIVDALDSYTEVSPSGRGLHILVKAALPDHVGRKQGAVEVYDALRYFAVTGERLAGTPASLEERQGETLALYATLAREEAEVLPTAGVSRPCQTLAHSDAEVVAKALAAANGATRTGAPLRGEYLARNGVSLPALRHRASAPPLPHSPAWRARSPAPRCRRKACLGQRPRGPPGSLLA